MFVNIVLMCSRVADDDDPFCRSSPVHLFLGCTLINDVSFFRSVVSYNYDNPQLLVVNGGDSVILPRWHLVAVLSVV